MGSLNDGNVGQGLDVGDLYMDGYMNWANHGFTNFQFLEFWSFLNFTIDDIGFWFSQVEGRGIGLDEWQRINYFFNV